MQRRGGGAWRIKVHLGRSADGRKHHLERTVRGTRRDAERDIARLVVTMYECRPPWRPEYGPDRTRLAVVRFRCTKARPEWATCWRDRNSKFHRYDPLPPSRDPQHLVDAVEVDRSGIFWGRPRFT